MNILKRIAALATAGLSVAVLFTACGETSKVVGKWECSKVNAQGMEVTAEEYAELLGSEMEINLEFKEDGTVVMNLFGEKEEDEYDTDSDVLLEEDGASLKYDEDSDTVVYEDAESKLTFERE